MDEERKAVIEALRDELEYRREKQWKIFSWVATLLLAAIAGVITLAGKGEFRFPWPQRIVAVVALVAISRYARLWVNENIRFESCCRNKLLDLLAGSGLARDAIPDPERAPNFGYARVIILLMLGAILTILFASPVGCVTAEQQKSQRSTEEIKSPNPSRSSGRLAQYQAMTASGRSRIEERRWPA